MRIPAVEALFPAPWTVAARRMLPSPSPQFTATAMWGPVLGWCALELLAESIDVENPERVALDLFDRLRLREPFAQAFTALGLEGEEGWRAAARIKVVLLTGAGVGKPEEAPAEPEPAAAAEESPAEPDSPAMSSEPSAVPEKPFAAAEAVVASPASTTEAAAGKRTPGETTPTEPAAAQPAPAANERVALSAALWLDPDVRWLTGVHEAEGHFYLVRELYEELLWWLQMPPLLRLAGEPAPRRATVVEMSKTIDEALASAEAAGFRVNVLLGLDDIEAAGEEAAPDTESGGEPEVEIPQVGVPEVGMKGTAESQPSPAKPPEPKTEPSPGPAAKA
jgi:hypothetical protein